MGWCTGWGEAYRVREAGRKLVQGGVQEERESECKTFLVRSGKYYTGVGVRMLETR